MNRAKPFSVLAIGRTSSGLTEEAGARTEVNDGDMYTWTMYTYSVEKTNSPFKMLASTSNKMLASNAGKGWSADDHVLLQRLHADGEANATIATRLGRSTGAISARLRHIADGSVPKTAEMRRVPATSLTPALVNAAAVRVARHAPPRAPAMTPSTPSSSEPQTPSAQLAALHISTPRMVSPSRDECPVHLRGALEEYNAVHPRNPFGAREVRGAHRKPCSECAAGFEGLDHYFTGIRNEKLCIECMEERLRPFLSAVTSVSSPSNSSDTQKALSPGSPGYSFI